jgi:hypothetical protein
MDMVVHDGEVPEFKAELLFGCNDEIKEQSLDFRVMQGHRVMVNFRSDMVRGPGL